MKAAIVLSTIVCLFIPGLGWPFNLQEMTDKSAMVITGTVAGVESTWNDEKTKIFTWVEIEVEEYLKGDGDKALVIRIPGGTAEGIIEVHPGIPSFSPGEKLLLFLDPGNPYSEVIGAYQRAFTSFDGGDVLDQKEGKNIPVPTQNPPVITNVTPSSASAGTHSVVTIEGNNFGSTPGQVLFRATGNVIDRQSNLFLQAPINSWSNTQITCEVPVAVVNNIGYSAGSFNDTIYVDNGSMSNGFPFNVTFGYSGQNWLTNTVLYFINENTNDCTGEGAVVQAAANSWNGPSNFSFVYAGSTDSTDYGQNGKNEVLWTNNIPGFVETVPCWFDALGNIIECDMVFDDSQAWRTDGTHSPTQGWDIQAFATHAFGHMLKLYDLYGDNDYGKVMGRVNDRQAPSDGDIAGAQHIYGVNPNLKPNFTPYHPGGWSDRIVVSNTTGIQTDSNPIYSTDTLYLDWAWINNGTAAVTTTLFYDLYLDGNLNIRRSMTSTFNVGQWNSQIDYPLGSLSPGTHTLRVVLDPDNAITETSESDNEYTKTITVLAPPGAHTLTVTKTGTGSGTLTGPGISCGPDCNETYQQVTKATLKATADPGSTFKGWVGACTGTKTSCKLTVNGNMIATANFALPDLRGGWSNILVTQKTDYQISGTLTVFADEGGAPNVQARIYLSDDGQFDPNDTLLGSVVLGTIKGGASKSKTLKYTATTNPAGKRLVGVIDPDNAIQESNEANNTATGQVP